MRSIHPQSRISVRCTFIHGGCPRSLRYDCQRCQLRTNRRSVIYCPVRIWRAHLSIPVAASWRAASRKPAACAMGCFCCSCALVRWVGRISIGSRVAPKSVAGLAPARAANLLPPSNQVRRAGARFPPWFCAAFAPLPTSACLQSWPTPAKSMRPSRDPAARPVHGVRGPSLSPPSKPKKSPPSGEEMVGNAHSAFTAEDRCPGKAYRNFAKSGSSLRPSCSH